MKIHKADAVQYAWGHSLATIGMTAGELLSNPITKTVILGIVGGIVSLAVKDLYTWIKQTIKKATSRDSSKKP